jgi:hypothetical protein
MSRDDDNKAQPLEDQLVPGTAADVAIAVAKRNRNKPWAALTALAARQITPWTTTPDSPLNKKS